MCRSIEVIMTKELFMELNEPSKQIKIMKHFVLPNRQATVLPESHLGWVARAQLRVSSSQPRVRGLPVPLALGSLLSLAFTAQNVCLILL